MQKDLSGSVWYTKVDYDALAAELAAERAGAGSRAQLTWLLGTIREQGQSLVAAQGLIRALEAALQDIETSDDIQWVHGRCARALATAKRDKP